jgi:hypothetical protein
MHDIHMHDRDVIKKCACHRQRVQNHCILLKYFSIWRFKLVIYVNKYATSCFSCEFDQVGAAEEGMRLVYRINDEIMMITNEVKFSSLEMRMSDIDALESYVQIFLPDATNHPDSSYVDVSF